jgi:anthranilate phosphoribosyltransferase
MAGFLDATRARLAHLPAGEQPLVVLPSYNGARKLPVLTPLLALLVARRGLPVLINGTATESVRVTVPDVLQALGLPLVGTSRRLAPGEVAYLPTEVLCPGLKRLLDVRRVVGLRNSAHSLVKLMNPCAGPAVIVSSYTHPEYAISMAAVFEAVGATALLLRGTEGEAVADARRLPQMEGFIGGRRVLLEPGQKGTLSQLPELPREIDPASTAAWMHEVLENRQPVPPSVALQVEHILRLASSHE